MTKGCVYWITGLSGVGKTTIGRLLYSRLKSEKANIVFLDGDVLRDVFGNDLDYSVSDREKSAFRNSKLCRLLSDQGIDVVCCTISLFHDIQKWNRDNIERYCEIYLKAPIEVLRRRDPKKLYKYMEDGRLSNMYGMDIIYEEPIKPDIEMTNDGAQTPEKLAGMIADKLLILKKQGDLHGPNRYQSGDAERA